MKRVGVVSLGCAKNRVDTEVMLGRLSKKGFEITNDINNTDILIINTCGFISASKEESIDTIVEFAEGKKRGIYKKLIVMGCLSQRYSEEIIRDIPEVDHIVGSGDIASIEDILSNKKSKRFHINQPAFIYDESSRILSTPKGSAYIKIAEGCSARCTFCIIPKLRGPLKSRPISSIVKEAEYLASLGVKEINLIAQDTTAYGMDIGIKAGLSKLVRELSLLKDIQWIRLLYCHSIFITDPIIKLFKDDEKLCRYIDIPLQHSHDTMLKKMGRREKKKGIIQTIEILRRNIPDISIRSTFIVGFPGETEEHFKDLYNFVKDMKFNYVGIFKYSKEEGTEAFKFKNDIVADIVEDRFDRLMKLQQKVSLKKNREKIGAIYTAIIEGKNKDRHYKAIGRLQSQAPEIDGVVYIKGTGLLPGDIYEIKITDAIEYDLFGEKIYVKDKR